MHPRSAGAGAVAEDETYYRSDLAYVHHRGFGFHGDLCAPGILALLAPVLDRRGLVVELGCGSGALTRHLVAAGHRVVATDASPAMLDIAHEQVPDVEEVRELRLPEDPIPEADAIVSIGHVLSYLDDEASVHLALAGIAHSLRPGGLMALDLCDLDWGTARADLAPMIWEGDGWFLATRFSMPTGRSFVRDLTTFLEQPDGSWRRGHEVHHNVLVDTVIVPKLLEHLGVDARVGWSFGGEELPAGLATVIGSRRSRAPARPLGEERVPAREGR